MHRPPLSSWCLDRVISEWGCGSLGLLNLIPARQGFYSTASLPFGFVPPVPILSVNGGTQPFCFLRCLAPRHCPRSPTTRSRRDSSSFTPSRRYTRTGGPYTSHLESGPPSRVGGRLTGNRQKRSTRITGNGCLISDKPFGFYLLLCRRHRSTRCG